MVRFLYPPPLQACFVVLEINETRIVIGPCSHRVIADVKEAVWRVRSQLTVGSDFGAFVYRLGLGIFIPSRGVRLPYALPKVMGCR